MRAREAVGGRPTSTPYLTVELRESIDSGWYLLLTRSGDGLTKEPKANPFLTCAGWLPLVNNLGRIAFRHQPFD